MKKIKAHCYWHKHRYMTRIYIQFFLVLMVAAIIINIFMGGYYAHRERQIMRREKEQLLEQTAFYSERILKEADTIAGTIWTSTEVQNLQKFRKENPDYLLYRDCMEYLANLSLNVNSVYRIDIYLRNAGSLITSGEGVFYNLESDYKKYYEECLDRTNRVVWDVNYSRHRLPYMRRIRETATLMRPIYSNYTGKKYALLCIEVPFSELYELNKSIEENQGFAIASEQQVWNLTTRLEEIWKEEKILDQIEGKEKGIVTYEVGKESYVCNFQKELTSGLYFTIYYPERNLAPNLLPVMISILLVAILFATVFFSIVRISRRKIAEPFAVLLTAMKEVELGNLGIQINDKRDDMFGELFSEFNHMSFRIKELMKEVLEERLRRKDFKFRLLQSQIKPHFLYNIFNNMIWMLEQKDYQGLEQMICATAGYYKTALNYGNKAICVEDNIKQLEYYLQIQKVRFGETFQCQIIFDPEILSLCIPNLLLQPLVENAINHGARPKEGITHISIRGYLEAGNLKFEVCDDGVGIEATRLEEIKEATEDDLDDGKKYFALVNIARRLRLEYHDRASFSIESVEGKWTKVMFTIPEDADV